MKRKRIENKHGIRTIFPVISWCKCEFCDNEVRREKVYCWYSCHGPYATDLFSCTTCVTSLEHCNAKIDEGKALRPKAPKAPPEPPKMRVG